MTSHTQTADSIQPRHRPKKNIWKYIWKFRFIYFLALPGILYFVIFRYVPLLGSVMAFQKYNIFKGFTGSPWVGFENFERMFAHYDFLRILKNTILLGVYDVFFAFPAAIIIALLLNELRLVLYKKIIQTVIYMPHFLSWVIISGIAVGVFSPSAGIFNQMLNFFGFESVYVLASESYIRPFLVGAGMWRDVGYSTIIYLAALASINPEMYEASEIDGANRWRQTISITIPSLMPTVVILFLLQIGNFLDFGFERVWVFLNSLNNINGEILDTYIYRLGILSQQYSYTTAIGLFKSVVGLILILIVNSISKKTTGESLF